MSRLTVANGFTFTLHNPELILCLCFLSPLHSTIPEFATSISKSPTFRGQGYNAEINHSHLQQLPGVVLETLKCYCYWCYSGDP